MSTASEEFFALHQPGNPFILPNAWDPVSALIFERAGFTAVGTSSAAMAWALGYADGECVDTDALFAAIGRVTRVLRVPLTADIEAGFGSSAAAVVRSVERAVAVGAVGANLEDFDSRAGDVSPGP